MTPLTQPFVAQPPKPRTRSRWLRPGRMIVVVAAIMALAVVGILIYRFFNPSEDAFNSQTNQHSASTFDSIDIPLDEISQAGQIIGITRSLSINGQLKVSNSLTLAPGERPTNAVAGQMYYDRNTNQLNYYNGSGFVELATNPQTVTSIGGSSGEITLGGGLSLTGNILSSQSGVVSVTSASSNLIVTNDGAGNITIGQSPTGGAIQGQGGTAGRIAVFTDGTTIANSILSQAGNTLTVDGNVTMGETLTLQSAGFANINLTDSVSGITGQIYNDGNMHVTGGSNNLWLEAGGSGTIFLNAGNGNPVAINQSTDANYPLEVNGDINITAGNALRINGTIICDMNGCAGGGGAGVSSLNGLTGALTVANATAAGSTVTIDDASTSTKGIARFNSTNFSVTSGIVNTIQNIAASASPTFAGINTNTITPSGPLTVGATTQNLTLQGASTTITSTNGGNTATLSFVAPTANVTYRLQTAAAGTYDVCTTAGNCVGVGGSVTTPGGTTNRLAKFTSSNAIADSLISDNGSVVTVNGDLSVTGTVTLTTPLPVAQGGTGSATASGARTNLGAAASGANNDITSLSGLTTALSVVQGGTGATSLTANGVLLGNGTSAISSLAAGGAGLCLVSTVGAPTWASCPGGGGVTSVNSLTGALTIANSSGVGSTITIDDATTSTKGIASFNSNNFTVTSGSVNTIQDIGLAAAPQFGRLQIGSNQPSAVMLVVNNSNVSATGNLVELRQNGVNRLTVSPAGDMTVSGTVNGQTISSAASLTGSLAVAGVANLNGGASVTGVLTANTITPTSALTIGATNQSFTVQGNASSTLTATSGANTTTVAFQSPTASVTYRLLTAAAGTYDICTTVGNCAGTGGGVTTPGGTNNTIAKFTGSGTIANSIITDNGSTVAIGGTLAVNTITPAAAMTIGTTSQNLTLQGAVTTLTATSGGITNTLTFATPGTTNKTITLPNASGTVAVSASGPLAIDAAGNISCPSCVTSGGGGGGVSAVDSLDGLTGALTLANSSGVGTTITIDNASTSAKGIAQFNSTNFSASSGTINTIQDIAVSSTPTFGRLTVTSNQSSSVMMLINNTNASASGNLLDVQLNGASRLSVTPGGAMSLTGTLNGQTISSAANFTGTLAVASTANLNGGATVTGTLTANTITPSSSLTVGATNQSFLLQGSAGSTITATNGANTTTVSFQSPTAAVTYRFLTAAAGTYDICTTAGNCAGVGGGVTTPGGTTNAVAKFTGSGTIADSIITDNGSTVTIGGTLAVNTLTPTAALTIGATAQNLTMQGASVNLTTTAGGVTNSLSFATPSSGNKSIVIPNASGTLVVSASGPLAIDSAGNITCATCATTSGVVTSLNSQTGAVTLANASGSGGTVTIDNASTSAKGIASFNSTNFSVTSGAVNTIQDIATSSTPTFGRLTVQSSQASNGMMLINNTNGSGSGNLLDVQLNGSNRLSVTAAGAMSLAGSLNGQTISSAANFTGTLAVASTANLNGGATVTGTLTTNTITPTGALTVGATSQSFLVQGSSASTITATNGSDTTTLAFQAPTAAVTYRFLTAAAGTYDVCTTVGNCASVGGGVTTSGGTTNRVAKFNGSQTLTDSIITDNGSTVTIGGTLAVNTLTPTAALTIGATGQNLTMQGATVNLTSTNAGITNLLTFATPTSSNKTVTIPNASGTLVVSASGPLAIDSAGNITCATCATTSTSVASLNGLTGALTIANASGSGGTITIDDASTSAKGIASFNSTNFSAASGAINTIQDINTSAAPQFGRLRLASSQPSATMLFVNNTNAGATGPLLDLQQSTVSRLTVTPAGAMTITGTINSQTISSAANFTGTMTVASTANLNGGAAVTGTLNANTITPTGSMTIGATGQSLTIQGNASTSLTATNSGSTTTVNFQTPTANVTYRFLTAAAGTYDVCTTAGNCVGHRYTQTNQGNQSGNSPPAGDTVSNTTTATTFSDVYNIPANDCIAGRTYRITAGGLYSTNGSSQGYNISLMWGSTTIANTDSGNAQTPGITATNENWQLEAIVTCYTNFSSTISVEARGTLMLSQSTAGPPQTGFLRNNSTGQTVTTNSTQALGVRMTWGTTGDSITLRNFTVEAMGGN